MKAYGISVRWDNCHSYYDVLDRIYLHPPSQEEIDCAVKEWGAKNKRTNLVGSACEFDLAEEELPPSNCQTALLRSRMISIEKVIEVQKAEVKELETALRKAEEEIEELDGLIDSLEHDLREYE